MSQPGGGSTPSQAPRQTSPQAHRIRSGLGPMDHEQRSARSPQWRAQNPRQRRDHPLIPEGACALNGLCYARDRSINLGDKIYIFILGIGGRDEISPYNIGRATCDNASDGGTAEQANQDCGDVRTTGRKDFGRL